MQGDNGELNWVVILFKPKTVLTRSECRALTNKVIDNIPVDQLCFILLATHWYILHTKKARGT